MEILEMHAFMTPKDRVLFRMCANREPRALLKRGLLQFELDDLGSKGFD